MAVSGSEVRIPAMAARKKYNVARLEEVAGKAAVEQTARIEAELQKDAAELQKDDSTFASVKFKLDCRRVY